MAFGFMKVGMEAMSDDVAALFRRVTQGVYVIGVAHGTARDAFTASSLAHASYQPPLLSLAVNPRHASYRILRQSRNFAISVLDADQVGLARHFGEDPAAIGDKLDGVACHPGSCGAPILDESIAHFECEVVSDSPAGDHRLIVARVFAGRLAKPDAQPLIYAATGNLDGSAELFPAHLSGGGPGRNSLTGGSYGQSGLSRNQMLGVGFVFLWFLVGGIAHFVATDVEMTIVPPYIPSPRVTVLLSGACELIGAAGLLLSRTRRAAGVGLFLLTIAVTPANVYMLQRPDLFSVPHGLLIARLPLQVALLAVIAWSCIWPPRGRV